MSLTIELLGELPPIPRAAREVLALASDEGAGAADFSHAIESDPRMTMQLLRMANSAFFGRRQAVSNVRDAIVTIGVAEATRVAVGCALLSELGAPNSPLVFDDVMNHGISVARAWSRFGGETAAAGVLVDASILTMTLDPEGFELYVEAILETETFEELHWLETRLFGLDRCELTDLLAETWELPAALCEPLAGWHVCRDEESTLYEAFAAVTVETESEFLAAFANR